MLSKKSVRSAHCQVATRAPSKKYSEKRLVAKSHRSRTPPEVLVLCFEVIWVVILCLHSHTLSELDLVAYTYSLTTGRGSKTQKIANQKFHNPKTS